MGCPPMIITLSAGKSCCQAATPVFQVKIRAPWQMCVSTGNPRFEYGQDLTQLEVLARWRVPAGFI